MAVASRRFMTHHGADAPQAGSVLELGDRVAEPGGFGAVHHVMAVDGAVPRRSVVAKVYDPAVVGTGESIVAATRSLIVALENQHPPGWPERLLALPFWLAETTVDGEPRLIALMLNLTSLGYEPCTFDPGHAKAYRRRPLVDRLHLAASIAATAEIFEQIRYLHSDINPENCLVHLARGGDAQIIDLDAGAILITGHERPLSEGKPDDFLPPETRFASMAPVGAPNPFSIEAERWSVASLIGYLMFAVSPAFYLRNLAPQTLELYARSGYAWPDIDRTSELFTRIDGNQRAYDTLWQEFTAIPTSVGDLFRQFFRAATNGAERPSATQWRQGLLDLQEPPKLEAFLVMPNVAIVGETVELSWLTTNTSFVEIDGLGRQNPTGRAAITARETGTFFITLINPYGRLELPGPRLDVIRLAPEILIVARGYPKGATPMAGRPTRRPLSGHVRVGPGLHAAAGAGSTLAPRTRWSPIGRPGRYSDLVGRPPATTFVPPQRQSPPRVTPVSVRRARRYGR